MKTVAPDQKVTHQTQPRTATPPRQPDSNHVAKLNRMIKDKGKELPEIRREIDLENQAKGVSGALAADAGAMGNMDNMMRMGGILPGNQAGGMGDLLNEALRGIQGYGAGKGQNQEDSSPLDESGEAEAALAAIRNAQGGVSQAQHPGDVAPTQGTQKPTGPDLDNLVERILISVPKADGTAEVRIKIDPKILPGTEIAIVSRPGEGLAVEFMTNNVDSQRFLLPNLAALRERLAEKVEQPVAVRMSENASGDTGDGRSRNRRNLYEEMGDNRV